MLAQRVVRLAALVGLVRKRKQSARPSVKVTHCRVAPVEKLVYPGAHEHADAKDKRGTDYFLLEESVIRAEDLRNRPLSLQQLGLKRVEARPATRRSCWRAQKKLRRIVVDAADGLIYLIEIGGHDVVHEASHDDGYYCATYKENVSSQLPLAIPVKAALSFPYGEEDRDHGHCHDQDCKHALGNENTLFNIWRCLAGKCGIITRTLDNSTDDFQLILRQWLSLDKSV